MKALIYRRFGAADVLEWTHNWPEPEIAPRSVLVRVKAGSVNPKDVLLRKGKFRHTLARDPLPRVSGLDIAGEIIAVGAEIAGYRVGDTVFGMTNRFCGGLHCEVARLDDGEFCHAPSGISIEAAACVPLAAQTALQALRDCCRVSEGDVVLINGASGGVGHFAVQIARELGAEVHAVCGADNTGFVESLGAYRAYSYNEQPATQIDATFDSVFDVFGKLTRSAFARQLGKRGVYVSTVPRPATLWAEGLARLGASRRSRLVLVRSAAADLERLRHWIDAGRLVPHVERIYSIDQAADAHRHVESRHTVGKVCLSMPGCDR